MVGSGRHLGGEWAGHCTGEPYGRGTICEPHYPGIIVAWQQLCFVCVLVANIAGSGGLMDDVELSDEVSEQDCAIWMIKVAPVFTGIDNILSICQKQGQFYISRITPYYHSS